MDKTDTLRHAIQEAWEVQDPPGARPWLIRQLSYERIVDSLEMVGWHYKDDCVSALLSIMNDVMEQEHIPEDTRQRVRNRLLYGAPDLDEHTYLDVVLPRRKKLVADQLNQVLRDAGFDDLRFEWTGDEVKDSRAMRDILTAQTLRSIREKPTLTGCVDCAAGECHFHGTGEFTTGGTG